MTTKTTSKKVSVEAPLVLDDVDTGLTFGEDGVVSLSLEDETIEDTLTVASEDTKELETTAEDLETVSTHSVTLGSSDVASLITDIDDNVQYLTWLIYGKNGTGKTTLLSTVPGMLILAVEDGTLSIRDKAKGNAMKIKIDTWEKFESVYWLLANGKRVSDGIIIPTAKGEFKVQSIGIDTITKLANVCMRNVVLGEKERDASKDILKPTQNDWGKMAQKMQFWLNMYKELPVQKVWLCQERATSDDAETEEFSIYPDVNKALRNYIMSDADIIGRTYIHRVDSKSVQFRLLVGANDKCITKDRTTKLGYAIANPRLDVLYNKVFGE